MSAISDTTHSDWARRCGRRHASQQFADGLCRHPGSPRADRHPDSQFSDLDRADRGAPERRHGDLGSGPGRHAASDASDHVNRGSSQPRADSDLPRRLLGSHGIRDDGRHHRWHSPDAAVPAGPVCRVVPRCPTDGTKGKAGCDQRRSTAGLSCISNQLPTTACRLRACSVRGKECIRKAGKQENRKRRSCCLSFPACVFCRT